MVESYVIFFTLISTIIINHILIKKKVLLDRKYSHHKSFLNNNEIPLSGGLIFLLSVFIFYRSGFYSFYLIMLGILLVGIMSDLNLISSPAKRIIFQTAIILVFLFVSKTYIHSIRWEFLDYYFQNTYLGYIFTLFCLVILLNGANFMDGVNTLVTGYFLIIALILLYLTENFDLEINVYLIKIILITLLVIFTFNFFGKLFLGDGGAYLVSFIFGYLLINFTNKNFEVSPYFVACMLWYPAYENLFSIVRKTINKNSPTKADNKHLHQFLFIFIQSKLTYSNNTLNTLTGIIINFFNFLIFIYAVNYFNNTHHLVILLVISVIFYNFLYYFLSKKNHKSH